MPGDVSHRQLILLGSDLIERALETKSSIFGERLPEGFKDAPHPLNLFLVQWIRRLQVSLLGLRTGDEEQERLTRMLRNFLNDSNILVDDILTFKVGQVYQKLCPNGGLMYVTSHSLSLVALNRGGRILSQN